MSESRNGSKVAGLTLAALAQAKRLPMEFLRELGLHDLDQGGVGIPYFGPTGEPLFVRERGSPRSGKRRFYQPAGVPLAAYGQWRLDQAAKVGFLIVPEGESDCWVFWHHGLPALGLPGSGAARTLLREHIEAVDRVYVVREPDGGGRAFLEGVGQQLAGLGFPGKAFVLQMPDGVKDPADLHVQDPGQFKAKLLQAIQASEPLELPRSVKRHGQALHEGAAGLATTCLSSVHPVPVRWLVPGYLPLGKLVLLAGDGGHGKSTITLDLAANLSTGRPCLGLAYEPLPPSDVLLISCEDDYADTVVPRLLSAGADLQHVWRVDGIKAKDGKTAPFSLAHFKSMEAELAARPDSRLVVIDPAGAYVGRSGVDDYNDSELRSLLGPMAELAARRQVTILLVKHLVKGATAKAVHKVGGSAGYINTVRAAFVVAPDTEDPDRKLFLPLKFNLGPRPPGLAYQMRSFDEAEQRHLLECYGQHLDAPDCERLAQQLFRIDWLGTVEADADRVLGEQARQQRDPNKVDQCKAWLRSFLATYAYPSEEIKTAAMTAGFTFDNVKEAKAGLKAEGLRNSNRGERLGGVWWSGFGDPDAWTLRPLSPDTPHSPHSPHTEKVLEAQALATPAMPREGGVGSVGRVGTSDQCIEEGEL